MYQEYKWLYEAVFAYGTALIFAAIMIRMAINYLFNKDKE
jgi:hypothetical protein